MPEIPETRYATTADGVHVAYQVLGTGPPDLLYVPGFVSHVELNWEWPEIARFMRSLASMARLITLDRRGTGMSDRVPDSELPTLEVRMDDLRAVIEAVGAIRPVLMGVSEAAPLCALFAATHPDQIAALILDAGYPRYRWAPDYPLGGTPEEVDKQIGEIEANWGTQEFGQDIARAVAPTLAADPKFRAWFAMYLRRAASPGAAVAIERMGDDIDIRTALPVIGVPTLVIHRTKDSNAPSSRFMAERIAGAKLVELPGEDHAAWSGNQEAFLAEIERFLAGVGEGGDLDRVLSSVLFTDIVGSTAKAVEIGDRAWKELVEHHHQRVRAQLARFRGREIDVAGDGFLATFDGPARAVRCASAICRSVGEIGVEVRAGVHTGEVELSGEGIKGVAVHIGARIAALAEPSEVLVSSTVKDLVAGSGLVFEDAGEHQLKGVPDRWHLYRMVDGRPE